MRRFTMTLAAVCATFVASFVGAASGKRLAPTAAKIEWPWIAIADCESGDGDGRPPYRPNWRYNGLYDGGLNFHPATWTAATRLYGHGSRRYRYAWQAPARVQVNVAQRWLRATSWEQWPECSRKVGVR